MNRFPEDYYVLAEKETSAVNYWWVSHLTVFHVNDNNRSYLSYLFGGKGASFYRILPLEELLLHFKQQTTSPACHILATRLVQSILQKE